MMIDTKQLLERETLNCLLAAYIGGEKWGLMPPTERAVARWRVRQALSTPAAFGLMVSVKVKRRSREDRRFGGGCDGQTSQTLAEDYRGSDRQNQDRPLISEDGQSAHLRVGLPRSRR